MTILVGRNRTLLRRGSGLGSGGPGGGPGVVVPEVSSYAPGLVLPPGLGDHPRRLWRPPWRGETIQVDSSLLTGLVAYWKLEEVSGTRSDSHGTNHLTDNDTVGQNTGKVGNCAETFQVIGEYLGVASNAALQMGDIDFSVACWIFLDAFSINQARLIQKGVLISASTTEYVLCITNTSSVQWHVSNGTTIAVAELPSAPFATGTWYFIYAEHDAAADEIRLSFNNGSFTTAAHAGGAQVAENEFSLLGRSGGTGNDGRMDEVGIWKRKLTAGERASLYNAGSGITYPF